MTANANHLALVLGLLVLGAHVFGALKACQAPVIADQFDADILVKKGKLPYQTHEQDYALEYGHATVAMHIDALKPGARVLLIDDLLATGGTSAAATALVQKLGATIVEAGFLIELKFLNGREKLVGFPVRSLIAY